MASVRDLVEAGLDEGLVKQAVDAAGFERKRGRGGLNLDSKGVTKVLKTYLALLTKLTAKASKVNPEKFTDDEAPAPKAKAEKKPAPKPKKAKAAEVEEEDDEEPEEDDEVEEADDEEDDE